MKIKVENGTPVDRHLCATCEQGQVMADNKQNKRTWCEAAEQYINFQVCECSKYNEKVSDTLKATYYQQAIWLTQLPSGRYIGLNQGQMNDYAFLKEIRALDAAKNKVEEKTAKDILKEAESREQQYVKAGR